MKAVVRVILVASFSILLSACNADMILDVNQLDMGNPKSNGKISKGTVNFEFIGKCTDTATGSESDNLVKIDGAMYNLFKNKQERLNCKAADKFGLKSKVTYEIKVLIDTIEGDGTPQRGYPVVLFLMKDKASLLIAKSFSQRLKSRLNGAMGTVNESIYINLINNANKEKLRVISPSVYAWNEKEMDYIPYQYFLTEIQGGNLGFKLGSVAIDSLLKYSQALLFMTEKVGSNK